MIEDDRDWRRADQILDGLDHRQPRVELNVPRPAAEAATGCLKSLARRRRIRHAQRFKVEPDAADAAALHLLELCIGDLVVDDRDATRARRKLPDRVQRARIVGPIDARLDDDDAVHMECAMQRSHFRDGRRLGRIRAARPEREARRVAEDVGMTIACAGRHVEIHRLWRAPLTRLPRRGSRRRRERAAAMHEQSSSHGCEMNERRTSRYDLHGPRRRKTTRL